MEKYKQPLKLNTVLFLSKVIKRYNADKKTNKDKINHIKQVISGNASVDIKPDTISYILNM